MDKYKLAKLRTLGLIVVKSFRFLSKTAHFHRKSFENDGIFTGESILSIYYLTSNFGVDKNKNSSKWWDFDANLEKKKICFMN